MCTARKGVVLLSKILAAVDGSPRAKKALHYAISLAKCYDSTLTVMYVLDKRVCDVADQASFLAISRLINDMEEYGKTVLEEINRIAQSNGMEVHTVLVHGTPAEDGKYDLIVIGSRGLTPAKAFLLGSISDKVSHHAKCPVLIVK